MCSGNLGNSVYTNSGVGIMVLSCTDTEVYNNYGTGNKDGLHISGISAHTGSSIYNNTFLKCLNIGYVVGNAITDADTTFSNNILTADTTNITYSSIGFYVDTGTDQTNESNNCFYDFDTTASGHTLDSTDITDDPALDAKYKPTKGSPVIGAGITVLNNRDYYGEYRETLGYDIGAVWYDGYEDSTVKPKPLISGGTR